MPLTATQEIELVSLITLKAKEENNAAWMRIFVADLADAHKEALYDELLGATIQKQEEQIGRAHV